MAASSSQHTTTKEDDSIQQSNDSGGRNQGFTSWLCDTLFGKPETTPSPIPQPPAQQQQSSSSVLTSPFRPPTEAVSNLPPLTESPPPVPPPRRNHHRRQQMACTTTSPSSSVPPIIQSPMSATSTAPRPNSTLFPRYQQHVNRVSTTSTLVDDTDPNDDITSTRMHYGRAPSHTARRYATQHVRLTKGNFVIQRDVPDDLQQHLPRKGEEFTRMRYTAVTCDPDDFPYKNYTLRQQHYGRDTELFIVITMYNEDEILFARTMHGVMKNIAHLCKQKRCNTWNTDGWKKVVVAIVADGRKVINKRVLNMLAAMGIYQSGVAKSEVDDRPVTAHLYEYTTQISFDENMVRKGADKGLVPVQMLFCLKEKNAKKINSHRWFFNAFGPLLKPNVCVLLDVGTRPGNVSIHQLWKTFDMHPNVGGACGEIRAMLGPGCQHLINPLVAAQNFEYKMSNILDKPMESVFGYISVLPGAFSAYRYAALQNDVNGRGPLEKYFKGETLHTDGGLFEANMYLAEDRILCFELVAKKGERWLLQYCNSAFAETDVPDGLPEFISQRRRWLNGSFFAGVYSLWHFRSMWRSRHSFTRLVLLTIETLYNIISLIFNWIALGNFYIAFYFITKSLADDTVDPFGNGWGSRLFDAFRYIYLFVIVVVFICSMGNRPQVTKWLFIGCLTVFSLLMAYMLFASAWLIYKGIELAKEDIAWTDDSGTNIVLALENPGLRNMIVSVLATYGLYLVSSLLYRQPITIILSFLPYLILLPGFINILNIYAFCNTHDVSWGTKGDNSISKDLGVVKKKKTKDGQADDDSFEEVLPADMLDANTQYQEALQDLEKKQVEKEPPKKHGKEDYYRSFRTYLVLAWIACNALLIALVTSTQYDTLYKDSTGTTYMAFILWANAGLAVFRFLGSVMYLLLRLFTS